MAVTVADVEDLSAKGWEHLDTPKKEALLTDARAERDTLYTEKVATLPTLDGDKDVFTKNLAAHKWELASGGESQSESATGGSVTYNTVSGETLNSLTETRFGRTALEHLRNKARIGIVRTY